MKKIISKLEIIALCVKIITIDKTRLGRRMFILEEPYVSKFLIQTMEEKGYSVLENEVSKRYAVDYKLNLVDSPTSSAVINVSEDVKIYSNSENSIKWVLQNFKDSALSTYIYSFKDKVEFRKLIASIYPDFFFKEIKFSELDSVKTDSLVFPCIIKPVVGFLSLGVHKIDTPQDWNFIVSEIKKEVSDFSKMFPSEVVNSKKFIVEELIEGREYAVDAYYTHNGEPVILNIFEHPFVNASDVSDRAYISSKKIIEKYLKKFSSVLKKIGHIVNLKDFPMHIELRVTPTGEIIPIEINPMRFAGWCTTDLAYYAYGINIYECFAEDKKPNWEKILKNKGDEIYYFAMAEAPVDEDKIHSLSVQYEKLKKNFSHILNFRKIDYKEKPMAAIVFGYADNYEEIAEILKLNMKDFVKYEEVICK
ncbi:MAG: ATP-grasp domain-containing protein [Candidatus Gastranaerophilales bacterium]|nr:ATP-grasp domain-containing protein [Candidatus Gastranaerophilales bacterium]